MGTDRIAGLRSALPRLYALLASPLTPDALAAHCRRNRWVQVRDATLLDEEFEVRLGRGLVLRGELAPGEEAWHAALVVVWDRRWDTVTGKHLVCTYDMSHAAFDKAFERARAVSIAALGAPAGAGSRRPRYNYSWPTRHHLFWEEGERLLLLCQSEDPGAGGRSILVWLGSRSHLRRNPYLPHRLKATPRPRNFHNGP